MLRLAATYILTSLSEASRIMGLSHLDVVILMALATAPERITAHGLAASLNLPRETCRRRIKALQAAGWICPDRLALPADADCPDARKLRECLAMLSSQTRRLSDRLSGLPACELTDAGHPSEEGLRAGWAAPDDT